MRYVLDTNVVIYAEKGTLAEGLPFGEYFISVISEIELLSFASLTPVQEQALAGLLADVTVVGIVDDVKRRAIELRRQHRLRIPDAIVAATALALGAILLTNDRAMAGVPELQYRALALKP